MTRRTRWLVPSLGALIAAQVNAQPDAAGNVWSYSATAGAFYSTGKYGTATATDILAIPLVLRAENGRFSSTIAIPYLISKGPAVIRDIGPVATTPSSRAQVRGLGDIVASVAYDWYVNEDRLETIGVAGKVKFPTGNEDKGLGTGQYDYMVEMNATKALGRLALSGTAGYRIYGDLPTVELRDVFYASASVFYSVGTGNSTGASYDTRQKLRPEAKVPHDLTLFYSHRLTRHVQALLMVSKGFSDASQDWGGGLVFVHRF